MKKEMKMLRNRAYEGEACILTLPEETRCKLTGASYPLLPLPTLIRSYDIYDIYAFFSRPGPQPEIQRTGAATKITHHSWA